MSAWAESMPRCLPLPSQIPGTACKRPAAQELDPWEIPSHPFRGKSQPRLMLSAALFPGINSPSTWNATLGGSRWTVAKTLQPLHFHNGGGLWGTMGALSVFSTAWGRLGPGPGIRGVSVLAIVWSRLTDSWRAVLPNVRDLGQLLCHTL